MRRGLGVGAGLRHQGDTAGDEHHSFMRGCSVADAVVRYETDPWDLALDVSNLFDEDYIVGCCVDSCYGGIRRLAAPTAKYRY